MRDAEHFQVHLQLPQHTFETLHFRFQNTTFPWKHFPLKQQILYFGSRRLTID